MKVKITKCNHDGYWYHNRIGDIFDVTLGTPHDKSYKVNDEIQLGHVYYIDIDDCCVVEEEPDQQLTEFYETVDEYLDCNTFLLTERIKYEKSRLDSLEKEASSKKGYENENIAFIKGKIAAYNKALYEIVFSRKRIKGEFYRNKSVASSNK